MVPKIPCPNKGSARQEHACWPFPSSLQPLTQLMNHFSPSEAWHKGITWAAINMIYFAMFAISVRLRYACCITIIYILMLIN